MAWKDKELPLAHVKEPERAARTTIDDGALDDLVSSIRALGLIEPIVVTPAGPDLFEVVAGHRRLLAHKILGKSHIRARVIDDKQLLHAVRIHENLLREDLSPADQATYYAELYEELGDVDKVAELLRRTRHHVESRLELLAGWAPVLEAVRGGRITLSVAEQFNRLRHEDDVEFVLHHAARGGCPTKATAQQWVEGCLARRELAAPPAPTQSELPHGVAQELEYRPGTRYAAMAHPSELTGGTAHQPCMFCRGEHPEYEMFRKFVCGGCADNVLTRIVGDAAKQ